MFDSVREVPSHREQPRLVPRGATALVGALAAGSLLAGAGGLWLGIPSAFAAGFGIGTVAGLGVIQGAGVEFRVSSAGLEWLRFGCLRDRLPWDQVRRIRVHRFAGIPLQVRVELVRGGSCPLQLPLATPGGMLAAVAAGRRAGLFPERVELREGNSDHPPREMDGRGTGEHPRVAANGHAMHRQASGGETGVIVADPGTGALRWLLTGVVGAILGAGGLLRPELWGFGTASAGGAAMAMAAATRRGSGRGWLRVGPDGLQWGEGGEDRDRLSWEELRRIELRMDVEFRGRPSRRGPRPVPVAAVEVETSNGSRRRVDTFAHQTAVDLLVGAIRNARDEGWIPDAVQLGNGITTPFELPRQQERRRSGIRLPPLPWIGRRRSSPASW